jgi:hypothetical protein
MVSALAEDDSFDIDAPQKKRSILSRYPQIFLRRQIFDQDE